MMVGKWHIVTSVSPRMAVSASMVAGWISRIKLAGPASTDNAVVHGNEDFRSKQISSRVERQ
jgi:hypothetical protein